MQGYGQSKIANNLFAVELDHRGKTFGVRAFSLHPGSVNGTDPGRVAPMALLRGVQPYSVNAEHAKKLWKLSEEMAGVAFDAN